MKKLYFSREEKLAARQVLRKLKPPEWHERERVLSKESRVRHREKCNARAAAYRKKGIVNGMSLEKQYCIDHPERYLFWAARSRAKKNGIEFSITEQDIIIPEYCPVLGIKLLSVRQTRQNRDYVPSVDRIDNTKGYILGNIKVISFKANRYKTDMSIENIESLLLYCRGYTNDGYTERDIDMVISS